MSDAGATGSVVGSKSSAESDQMSWQKKLLIIDAEKRESESPLHGGKNMVIPIMRHPQLDLDIVECLESKIQYVCPTPESAELARIYDQDYNANFGRDFNAKTPEFVARRGRAQLSFIEKAFAGIDLELNAETKVAEVGAGWGAMSSLLNDRCQVKCYELDSQSVAFLKDRGLDAHFGGLEDDDQVENLDLILSSMMLEHVPKPLQVLKRWRKKLRPGGAIFIEIPLENPVPNWWGMDPADPYWCGHLVFFAPGHLEEMLTHAGFQVIATSCHDHPVSQGYTMPGAKETYNVSDVPESFDTKESELPAPKLLRLLAINK